MAGVKTFKVKRKFKGVKDLYGYLLKDSDVVEHVIGMQIQEPLNQKTFCIVGQEKVTERQVLFYASRQNFPESLGELIIFASAYDVDVVVFFLQKVDNNYLMPLKWLQKICTADYEFIAVQAEF